MVDIFKYVFSVSILTFGLILCFPTLSHAENSAQSSKASANQIAETRAEVDYVSLMSERLRLGKAKISLPSHSDIAVPVAAQAKDQPQSDKLADEPMEGAP